MGEDPGYLPTISNPLSCLSLLANSSGDGGILPKDISVWVILLLPALSVAFILSIWNGAVTYQSSWHAF